MGQLAKQVPFKSVHAVVGGQIPQSAEHDEHVSPDTQFPSPQIKASGKSKPSSSSSSPLPPLPEPPPPALVSFGVFWSEMFPSKTFMSPEVFRSRPFESGGVAAGMLSKGVFVSEKIFGIPGITCNWEIMTATMVSARTIAIMYLNELSQYFNSSNAI